MTCYTVVARTSGGWRSPPTLQAMTLDEAHTQCLELSNRYPNQEFEILGVVARVKRVQSMKIEPVIEEEENVMPLRRPA